ncbi:hypothetical protein PR003_g2802 [Phytophthora rubi]|uniref:Myb/SANT-like domain-containing protein n=1 Tax=Phytophthora rubi TaxID=129364 RepID=A0A6A3NTG0_9STRA|nr:hypothetical protein PR002_g2744 [Phytophthora rubi]KAE9355503.1 hypothetical protein PR003_g2802 [Phytophthora rubi]
MQSDLTKLQQGQQAPLTASEFLGSLPSGHQFQTLISVPLEALQQTQADSLMWEQPPSPMPQQETTARTPSVSTHGTTTCTRSVGKGKGNSKLGKEPKRMKWNNDMITELLRLRFTDGDVKRRIDSADTKTKKALAWQFFASVLSQSLGLVITQEQVYQKYRKLKSLYQKTRNEEDWQRHVPAQGF